MAMVSNSSRSRGMGEVLRLPNKALGHQSWPGQAGVATVA